MSVTYYGATFTSKERLSKLLTITVVLVLCQMGSVVGLTVDAIEKEAMENLITADAKILVAVLSSKCSAAEQISSKIKVRTRYSFATVITFLLLKCFVRRECKFG